MNLKLYAKVGAAVILGALLLSWWAGCWGRWRAENPPPPQIPPRLDEGQPIAPLDAPTAPVKIQTRVAELTPDQVGDWLEKYGLVATKVQARVAQAAPSPAGFVPGSVAAAAPEAIVDYPIRLAETSFCQRPDPDGSCPETSPSIDVTAAQPCPGCDVIQRGVWRELEREPCPDSEVFAAPGRFRTFVGVGAIGGSVTDDAGDRVTFAYPAALVGGTFEGIRVGPITLGGMGLAGVSQGGDVAGAVGIGISW